MSGNKQPTTNPTADEFGWLDGQTVVEDATAEFTLETAGTMSNGEYPVFIGKHAGANNPKFMAQVIKDTSRKSARKAQRGVVDSSMLDEQRKMERARYARHVFTDWRVVDAESKPVPYSYEKCLGLLNRLNGTNFDELANFFADERNFTRGALADAAMSDEEQSAVGND